MNRIIEVNSGRAKLKFATLNGELWISAKSADKLIKRFFENPGISGILILNGTVMQAEKDFFYKFSDFVQTTGNQELKDLLNEFRDKILTESAAQDG